MATARDLEQIIKTLGHSDSGTITKLALQHLVESLPRLIAFQHRTINSTQTIGQYGEGPSAMFWVRRGGFNQLSGESRDERIGYKHAISRLGVRVIE